MSLGERVIKILNEGIHSKKEVTPIRRKRWFGHLKWRAKASVMRVI